MLLDEAYVDEESSDPDEEKKTSELSVADDDFEVTALAEKEWAEREAETTVENKVEARQGRVRSGYTSFKLIIFHVSHLNFLSYHIFLHTSR